MSFLLVKAPGLYRPVAREWPPGTPEQTAENPGSQSEQRWEENYYVWHSAFAASEEEKQTKNKWTKKMK